MGPKPLLLVNGVYLLYMMQGTPITFTNKTDHQDIVKIFLKVALSTITLTLSTLCWPYHFLYSYSTLFLFLLSMLLWNFKILTTSNNRNQKVLKKLNVIYYAC